MSKEFNLKSVGNHLRLNILNERELDILDNAIFQLLSRTGMHVECEEAVKRMAGVGAQVEKEGKGFRVRFPEWVVRECLASAAHLTPWYGQSPEFDYEPWAGEPSILNFGVHVQVIDLETRKVRPTMKKDGELLYRLESALPYVPASADAMVATDYPPEVMTAAQGHSILSNTKKFGITAEPTMDGAKAILQMAHVVAGGEANFRRRPFICSFVSPLSPLYLQKTCSDVLIFSAENGMPAHVINMCLAGATGPVTLAGSVVLSVAELFACLVLVQGAQKGAHTILSTCSSMIDMRTSILGCGSPETSVICSASSEILAKHGLYGIFNSGPSDSKLTDAQAAYEFATNAGFMAATGASAIFGAGGLDGGVTFDFAKFMLDHECFGNIKRLLTKMSLTKEDLAVELMDLVGPGKSYLGSKHTLKHFKELSSATFFDRRKRDTWEAAGSVPVTEKAYQAVSRFAQLNPEGHLDKKVQTEIDGILSDLTKKYFR